MHKVTKIVSFCYGHRLLDYDGKCRYLHGHNGLLEIDVESDSLDELGMVVDFGKISDIVKKWVDSTLDHRMILSARDPIVDSLMKAGEPLYLMEENPTAENIAKHVFTVTRERGLQVIAVRLWETSSSYATYSEHKTDVEGSR